MKIWIVVLALVVAALGYLALVPTDDGSYTCNALPAALLLDPMAEHSDEFFFDAGTQCNADARRRGRLLLGVALFGSVAVTTLHLLERRRDQPPTIDS